MSTITADPLAGLIENRMHEAIAAGGDVAELAAIAVDAVLSEVIGLLEVHAAAQRNPTVRAAVGDCAERIMSAQFGGWSPPPPRSRGD